MAAGILIECQYQKIVVMKVLTKKLNDYSLYCLTFCDKRLQFLLTKQNWGIFFSLFPVPCAGGKMQESLNMSAFAIRKSSDTSLMHANVQTDCVRQNRLYASKSVSVFSCEKKPTKKGGAGKGGGKKHKQVIFIKVIVWVLSVPNCPE